MRDPMREFAKGQGDSAEAQDTLTLLAALVHLAALILLATMAAGFGVFMADRTIEEPLNRYRHPGQAEDGSWQPIGDSWHHGEAAATSDSTAGTPLDRTQPTEETNASQR